jgi:zinc D-Ala-D-Ala carboxypeptidase
MKYFRIEEFDSPDVKGSGEGMNKEILQIIDKARDLFGKPIYINSGMRTIERNALIGGKSNSSHLRGYAIDVACENSRDRFRLIELFLLLGINRIGIADSFIHIDNDPEKDCDVIWIY